MLPLKSSITETFALQDLIKNCGIDHALRLKINDRAVKLVNSIRNDSDPSMMELFLGEYGLSSQEGVALMCLAEALLRVPDGDTIDALIEDKIAPSAWGKHLGQSHSTMINASTWALYITGKVLDDTESGSVSGVLHGAIKRLGEPIIRQAVARAMKEMGNQFVLGETISAATKRAEKREDQGYTYSYDMLGEAAITEGDAKRYHIAYSEAILELSKHCKGDDIHQNPGISIKLSALHPRYETRNTKRVLEELVPRARSLAILAKSAGIGLNIDAEEADRLDLSLDVIKAVLSEPALKGWDGFGIVVQAYGVRAPYVIDCLYDMAVKFDRKIMVRLVKGAYWDTEIKLAQVEGHESFPVFTRKASTDVSYLCCAEKLLAKNDRIYPQFATHNAHSIAAVLEMTNENHSFEFQRLHGMGEAVHDQVLKGESAKCRIYAPVGAHKDLLAYLVRRLLENGANSSFVNQIVDETVPAETVASDPFEEVKAWQHDASNKSIQQPHDLYAPDRVNSQGLDITDPVTLETLETNIQKFDGKHWSVIGGTGETIEVKNPATHQVIGCVQLSSKAEVEEACSAVSDWPSVTASKRAVILRKAADLYEENAAEMFALLMAEAGKTLDDCVGELREAVDFIRYYAVEAENHNPEPAGVFSCISPWNFPLAIFSGQISAALAAGNKVIAKPAESTNLIAGFAVNLMKQAGVPEHALKLVYGTGSTIGPVITSSKNVNGVAFTGSTTTAKIINKSMSENLKPEAVLIAETGGLNAMIVDSTAMPEQAVIDIVASAFQSAGQRCSALRVLYLQEDIAECFLKTLYGAMDQLNIGNPRDFSTDIGPVIDRVAQDKINMHIESARLENRILKQCTCPNEGTYVAPSVIKIDGIQQLKEEIFGPVLHVALFKSDEIDKVISDINATGFGLTFGLHTRIDDRVQHIVDRVECGNIYVNRNQIGAVVGSQPFGGDGLSGTGPKAGGPKYLHRFAKVTPHIIGPVDTVNISVSEIENIFEKQKFNSAIEANLEMPGPVGESNQYSQHARKHVLCIGPNSKQQLELAKSAGCSVVALEGRPSEDVLFRLTNIDAVIDWSDTAYETRKILSKRAGAIVPVFVEKDFKSWMFKEKHICINTTASGGNADLLASLDS